MWLVKEGLVRNLPERSWNQIDELVWVAKYPISLTLKISKV